MPRWQALLSRRPPRPRAHRLLKLSASAYTWAAATVGSESAAPLQLAADEPVMSIGGFNGTDPTPALAQFQRMVAAHGHLAARPATRAEPGHPGSRSGWPGGLWLLFVL